MGTVRLWHVSAGGIPALMLGPLAVEASCRKLGVGAALMDHALAAAKARGHGAVILLGDAPYYARFGFSAAKTGELSLPGPFERDRLLGLELREGALDGAWGMIVADRRAAAKARAQEGARPCRARLSGQSCRTTAIARRCARSRVRSTVTTILLILIAVMIVRDILVRRWGSPPAASDVTQPVCALTPSAASFTRNPTSSEIEVPMPRRLISTGSPFEKTAGYSRAVIDGDFAFVAGTTGYDYTTMTMPADVTSQSRNCFKTIEAALKEGGFAMADIVRATYYITDAKDVDAHFAVCGEVLGEIRPAATLLVVAAPLQARDEGRDRSDRQAPHRLIHPSPFVRQHFFGETIP